ncbi:hypothetical protein [Methylomonas sp. AM2-LC]|uniref:hypothetical protein n=1 Tax=Methylomonas sp. AM2-LC TaxID=3153301 RepID=UPI003262F14B
MVFFAYKYKLSAELKTLFPAILLDFFCKNHTIRKMTAQPQTTAKELVDRLAGFARSEKTPSEFEIAAFKRESKKLAKVDQARSDMCLGMIACLEGNIEVCKKKHELSIRNGQEFEFHINYYASLIHLKRLYDANLCLENALLLYPNNPELISEIMINSYFLGLYDKSLQYADRLAKVDSGILITDISSESKLVLDLGISIDSLYQAAKFIDEVCRNYSVKMDHVRLIQVEDGVLKWIETSTDVATTVAMNCDLFEKFAKADDFDLGDFSVSFRSRAIG